MDAEGLKLQLEAAAWLRGTVSDREGRSIAGAHVIAGDEPPADPQKPVRLDAFVDLFYGNGSILPRVILSDQFGRFEMGMPAKSGGFVYAMRPGERTSPVMFLLDDTAGLEAEVALRMSGGYLVSGLVEAPVTHFADAKVWAESDEDHVRIDGRIHDQGSFQIALAKPGVYGLFAKVPGLVQDGLVTVQPTENDPHARADIRLVKGTTLSGSIRFTTGEPLVNGAVELRRPTLAAASNFSWSGSRNATRTRDDGSFRFDGVHPGEDATLCIWAACKPKFFYRLRPELSPFEFVVEPAALGEVELQVVDAVTGAPITAYEYSVPGNCDWRRVLAPDGRCVVHLQSPERELLIRVRSDGYADAQSAPFRAQPDDIEVEIQLGTAGGLELALADEAGQPCAGATVVLFSEGSLSVWSESQPVVLATDSAGVATAAGLPPGRYWLACRKDDLRLGPIAVRLPSGRSERRALVLSPGESDGAIAARLCADPQDGTNYEFALEPSNLLSGFSGQAALRSPASARSDTVFDQLQPGVYILTMVRDGEEGNWCRVVVEPRGLAALELCEE